MVFLAACSFPAAETNTPETGWIDWDGKSTEASNSSSETGTSMHDALAGEAPAELSVEAAPPMESEEWDRSAADQQNANLRAGSVDDNQQWDDYLLYRIRFADWGYAVHDVDVTERVILRAVTPSGAPVLGAAVSIQVSGTEMASLRTHADGQALFFPARFLSDNDRSFTVVMTKGQASVSRELERGSHTEEFILDAPSTSQPVQLDIQFLIDVTGSMSDEIQQLKENMIRISSEIESLPSEPDARFAMTIYRDRGDEFVSRSFEFTPDVEYFTRELEKVQADGGGDYPESLNEGFHNTLTLPEWRVEDTVSLLFILADAPPHLDYAQDFDYAEDIFLANEMGVKVYPIASSGLDDQGEYILRQLAQISGGKFLFLTYGADGAPGDDTTHHVDEYSVLSLDELVVRMVSEELAALDTQ